MIIIIILLTFFACKFLLSVNNEFSGIARSKFLSDGTTAVVAAIHGNYITVANGEIEAKNTLNYRNNRILILIIYRSQREIRGV